MNPQSKNGIALSPYVDLSGGWVSTELKPRIDLNSASSFFGLMIAFSPKRVVAISADTFIWLRIKAKRRMSLLSFPNDLLETARDEQVRMVALSKYSIQPDGIVLNISKSNGGSFEMSRYMGEVLINEAD